MKKLLLSFLVLMGCSTSRHYVVKIDGLADPSYSMKNVFVLNLNDKDSDLQKKEFVKYVQTVLKDSGFNVVNKIAEADTVVAFNYALDISQQEYTAPVYNYQAPASYSYSGTTYGSSGSYNTNATLRENGYGTYQYAGERRYVETSINRALILVGRRAADIDKSDENKKAVGIVWETRSMSSGSTTDMRHIFPAMLLASQPYLGKTTQGQQTVHFSDDDKIQELIQRSNGTGQLTMK